MRCFTVAAGVVTDGIQVDRLRLSRPGVEIDAVIVGEEGRGRALGVLPVSAPLRRICPNAGKVMEALYCPACGAGLAHEQALSPGHNRHGPDTGPRFHARLYRAGVGQTRSGRPKLVEEAEQANASESACIVAFRTHIGFRGGNAHTGDRYQVPCPKRGEELRWRYSCDECGYAPFGAEDPEAVKAYQEGWIHPETGVAARYRDFPGQVLVRGRIAQGAAGRMAAGEQIVAIMPRGVVFRTGYSGRLYDAPAEHYYVFDGQKILAATRKEREITDVF